MEPLVYFPPAAPLMLSNNKARFPHLPTEFQQSGCGLGCVLIYRHHARSSDSRMTALNNDAKIVPLNPTIEHHYNRFDGAKEQGLRLFRASIDAVSVIPGNSSIAQSIGR
jgi:hypothetical protein